MKVEIISPKKLLFPNRLDLACKYLFFKELENDIPDSYIVNLYREHIFKRSGGVEGGDRWIKVPSGKNCVDDYITSAKKLHVSMKENGFDINYPVPYYITNNGIENGAHRISCALALGIDVYAMKVVPKRYKRWDEKWFIKKEFSHSDIKLLKETYASLLK